MRINIKNIYCIETLIRSKPEIIEFINIRNPKDKKIHISNDKLHKKSITSISVVAHEIGHAIQDKENYKNLNR